MVLRALLLGAAGGFLLNRLGMPAGGLCGAMLATAAAAQLRLPMRMPNALGDATFVVLGTSMGAALNPDIELPFGRHPLPAAGRRA